jgi:hypothetical protein
MARVGRAERDRSASSLHVGLGRAARTEMPTTTYEDARRLKKACNKCRHIPARETGPCSYDQRVLVVVLSSLFRQTLVRASLFTVGPSNGPMAGNQHAAALFPVS